MFNVLSVRVSAYSREGAWGCLYDIFDFTKKNYADFHKNYNSFFLSILIA